MSGIIRITAQLTAAIFMMAAVPVSAQAPATLSLLDVPYIQQSEALCGGAAAAMVMRYWGATGIYAESFEPLVDAAAGGIRADVLLADLGRRGWDVRSFRGDEALVVARLADRQPVVALIEDRPGAYHFVVIVAWVNDRVVYHDPARAPFRVANEAAFSSAWEKSGYWTMLLLPRLDASAATPSAATPSAATPSAATPPAEKTPCDGLVDEGIRAAGRGDRSAALEIFASAGDLCRASSAPFREAAGVHALDGRWGDAARMARLAVERAPQDEHAWRILATSAFVGGDPEAALAAWNAIGEPSIDLVTIQGLDRTRHAAAAALLNLRPNATLTAGALASAELRLESLPAADGARVNYRPIGSGRANVEALVIERPRFPSTRSALVTAGLSLFTDRELALNAVNLAGGGDRMTVAWRWWDARPRIALSYTAPSRLGVWRTDIFSEKQSYGPVLSGVVESRKGGALSLSNWTTRLLRWEAGAGLDTWRDRGRTATLFGGLEQRWAPLATDALAVRGTGTALVGEFGAWAAGAAAAWQSQSRREGVVVLATGGVDVTSDEAPLALWPGAGTGHGRTRLLRAHPLLEDGRIEGAVFGRTVTHASIEGRRWTRPVLKLLRIAPAVFIDAARADRRRDPGTDWQVDAGVGVRFALPGSGVLRLDLGKGLRDGATALSIGWAR